MLVTTSYNTTSKILSIRPFLCHFYQQKLPKFLSSDVFFELKFQQKLSSEIGKAYSTPKIS